MQANPQQFSCFCSQKIPFDNLKQHIKECQKYQSESPFFKEFNNLPMDRLQEVHFMAIYSEFDFYLDILKEKLKKFGRNFDSVQPQTQPQKQPQQQFQVPQPQKKNFGYNGVHEPWNNQDDEWQTISNNNNLNSNINNIQSQMNGLGLSQIKPSGNQNMVQCGNCHKQFDQNYDMEKIWYLQKCVHVFCKLCLAKQIQQDYVNLQGQIPCKTCNQTLEQNDIQFIIGQEKLQKLEEQNIFKMFNLIKCMNCNNQMEFQPGKFSGTQKDLNGNQLSKQAEEHYIQNRFTCPDCKTEQCKSCNLTPYHIGYSCEDFKKFKDAKHCRYCDQQMLKPNNKLPPNLQDICESEECMGKAKHACQKVNRCGHACYGVHQENVCPPCLHEDCSQNNQDLKGQTGDDYCNICFVEGLNAAPVMRLQGCGHFYHYHCLKKRLEVKWPSARVTFNFCLCPLCKGWMQFSEDSDLKQIQDKNHLALEEIKRKSQERLKHEERLKDEKLTNPNSQYYGKPLEYAMAIYAYYQCFKCKDTYFGGLKDCQAALDEGSKDFKPEELVCANCCEIPIENCNKHGKDFIEFKCKFCCSIAQWFCWGTTHFCDACHKKQCAGDYVSKYPKEKLPKCTGKDTCPLKTDHKPNGEECSLGCSVCRNVRDNAKSF